jgi:hypothetical protein
MSDKLTLFHEKERERRERREKREKRETEN